MIVGQGGMSSKALGLRMLAASPNSAEKSEPTQVLPDNPNTESRDDTKATDSKQFKLQNHL